MGLRFWKPLVSYLFKLLEFYSFHAISTCRWTAAVTHTGYRICHVRCVYLLTSLFQHLIKVGLELIGFMSSIQNPTRMKDRLSSCRMDYIPLAVE